MPLELGMFLGAQRFGAGRHKNKNCLILDREPFRYQQFLSDISGQDIAAHGGDATALIAKVRDWLNTVARAPPLQPAVLSPPISPYSKWTPRRFAQISILFL